MASRLDKSVMRCESTNNQTVIIFSTGHRRAILNFCRPLSHAPASAFEWKDCDLALCAIEISGTLLSEFLRGVREVASLSPVDF